MAWRSQLTCRAFGTKHLPRKKKKWKCSWLHSLGFWSSMPERVKPTTVGGNVSTATHRIEKLWRSQIIKFSVGFLHTDARWQPSVNKPLWKNIRCWGGGVSAGSVCVAAGWADAAYPMWARKRMYWFWRVSFQFRMGGWLVAAGIQTYGLQKLLPSV